MMVLMDNTNTAPKLSKSQTRNLARLIEVGSVTVSPADANTVTGFNKVALASLASKGVIVATLATVERVKTIRGGYGQDPYTCNTKYTTVTYTIAA